MLEEALKEEDHVRIRGELLKRDCDWFEFRFNCSYGKFNGRRLEAYDQKCASRSHPSHRITWSHDGRRTVPDIAD